MKLCLQIILFVIVPSLEIPFTFCKKIPFTLRLDAKHPFTQLYVSKRQQGFTKGTKTFENF